MANKLSTDEALKDLLSERGIYHKLKVNASTVRSWRKQLKEGALKLSTKMEILKLGGYRVAQELKWQKG